MEKNKKILSTEELKKIEERTNFIRMFFKRVFPNNDIEVIVSKEKDRTYIISEHEKMLACYCKGSELIFLDDNSNGNILFTVMLNSETEYDKDKMENWFKTAKHKKVYRIFLDTEAMTKQPPLMLTGWNYRKKETREGKYPVFSEYEPKVYFNKGIAIEIADELKKQNYSVIII
jgi:hypothetical protein